MGKGACLFKIICLANIAKTEADVCASDMKTVAKGLVRIKNQILFLLL